MNNLTKDNFLKLSKEQLLKMGQESDIGYVRKFKNLLIEMAIGYDTVDIYALCGSNKVFSEFLCENKEFWAKYIYELNYAIKNASESGQTETVKLLLEDKRVNPSADNNEAIRLASRNGHTEVVRLLLNDPRVDPSDQNNKAIINASRNGHTEVVKLLLSDKRVDPSADMNHAIYSASKNKHIEVLKLLRKDPRFKTDTTDLYDLAVDRARKSGNTEILNILLGI